MRYMRDPSNETTPKPAITERDATVPVESEPLESEQVPVPGPGLEMREREMLIARAAYFRAEKRGFAPGGELQDWVEAEAEVLQSISNA